MKKQKTTRNLWSVFFVFSYFRHEVAADNYLAFHSFFCLFLFLHGGGYTPQKPSYPSPAAAVQKQHYS